MTESDRRTCRWIAFALLAIYAGMNAALFYHDVPTGNKDIVGRSMATLENLLFAMSMFFFGASVGKKGVEPEPMGGFTVSASSTTQSTRTEKIEPKEEPKP